MSATFLLKIRPNKLNEVKYLTFLLFSCRFAISSGSSAIFIGVRCGFNVPMFVI